MSPSDREFVLAIDFGGTKTALATYDGDGRRLGRRRIDTECERGAERVVRRTVAAGRDLLTRTAADLGGGCVAVGVATPGVVRGGRVLLSPNLPGWEDLALHSLVADGLGIEPVALCTDVKAAAMAEARWGSLQGADPGVYLNLGTGIAAALVIGGSVLMGAHGAAGEIAYNVVDPADFGAPGDGRAPLEEIVGGRHIGERARDITGGVAHAHAVFHAARGDAEAGAFIAETLAQMSMHVANLAILVDPARIAIGAG
jgi:glucokinase